MFNIKFLGNKTFLLADEVAIRYFLGVSIKEGYLLINDKKAVLFTDARYFDFVKTLNTNIQVEHKLFSALSDIKLELESQNIKSVYINYEKVTLSFYQELKGLKVKLKNGSKILQTARSKKSKKELLDIEKSCDIIFNALMKAVESLKVGVTENEIREIIVKEIVKNGGEGESFESIVAFSKNSAIPHHQTGNTSLEKNSVVLIDTGCVYNGYCSDITRTYFFGEPTKEFIDNYNAVLNANLLGIEKIKVGFTEKEADAVAREYLKSKNLDKYFTHSLGHGVGLEIHENIRLSPKSNGKLKSGQVFTIEPGVYFENKYGIRIEDTVVLTKKGVKRFFTDDKSLKIIK